MKTVEIAVIHRRPGYAENVEFVNVYHAKPDPKLDFKQIFAEAFTIAHPTWTIKKVKIKNQQ